MSVKKSIIITEGMISDSDLVLGTFRGSTGLNIPCISFPDGNTSMLRVNTPIPNDWDGSQMTLKTVYTANGLTGDFFLQIVGAAIIIDDPVLSYFGNGGEVLSPPIALNVLAKHEMNINLSQPADYLNITFRRQGGAATDTSFDLLQIVSVTLEYYSN